MDHDAGADVAIEFFEEAADDPAVAFGPGQRTFFIGFSGGEVVDAGPCGDVLGESAVIVAAGVVDVPAQVGGSEALLVEPGFDGDSIKRRRLGAELHRDRELTGGAELVHAGGEAGEVLAIAGGSGGRGLDALLPSAVEVETLLRREAEIALLPDAVAKDAEVFEKLANERGFFAGNGNVVGGPGIGRDFVLAPARVAAALLQHFEENEIVEAALV